MNDSIIRARGLGRSFGDVDAVSGVDLDVGSGSVLGLIGPNGAGKTTLLRALLGLTRFDGELEVLGSNPASQRSELMQDVCFIADTAVLPGWMKVKQLLDYAEGIHPRFDRRKAESLLASTEVSAERYIGRLSKGMTVQLHLALVMAINARLLILDEPTLGLDILFRKRFFEQLLNDYFDEERTIIISTHQVEEVQNILTDVVFMDHGQLILKKSMAAIEEEFLELHAVGANVDKATALPHVGSRSILGGRALIYENQSRDTLAGLGDLHTPSIADLFVAKIAGDQRYE